MEFRQLVQAKVSQKKATTVDTSESSAGPAEEESFAYRKLRQYFRWEYHNVWLAEDKQRNEYKIESLKSHSINESCHNWLTE